MWKRFQSINKDQLNNKLLESFVIVGGLSGNRIGLCLVEKALEAKSIRHEDDPYTYDEALEVVEANFWKMSYEC